MVANGDKVSAWTVENKIDFYNSCISDKKTYFTREFFIYGLKEWRSWRETM